MCPGRHDGFCPGNKRGMCKQRHWRILCSRSSFLRTREETKLNHVFHTPRRRCRTCHAGTFASLQSEVFARYMAQKINLIEVYHHWECALVLGSRDLRAISCLDEAELHAVCMSFCQRGIGITDMKQDTRIKLTGDLQILSETPHVGRCFRTAALGGDRPPRGILSTMDSFDNVVMRRTYLIQRSFLNG
ncbi:hypothetical protein NEOLEDRAFT_311442 [Neolentinus lepideus HHB14362 ss-1]|uniref:Uncharacterized protein n=1 Tax=Neolentinus lepideus HHB14362 ss-1 TaxID=1314782 RepID=A0A165VSR5_9AGAM|nr:hypothetical protein NEOLEDRAFT_311442 [Neolentinus lepideus HHB14362 ss-1]